MFTTKLQINTKICAALLVLSFLVPVGAQAQTATQYQPQTREQIIAYLFGQITQLQILLAEKIAEEKKESNNSASNSSSDVDVDTLNAQNVTHDSVTLRGEIDLKGEAEAYVWFDYVDENDRERQTTRKRVTDYRGDEQTFTTGLSNLKNDERYYFRAVAEDENGNRAYGSKKSFTTENKSSNNGNDNYNDEFDLSINNRSIQIGESVEVEWELPGGDVNSQNWIGVYEVGNTNKDFVVWKYITQDEGSLFLKMNETGTFEARLFLKNSYDDEVISETFTVSR